MTGIADFVGVDWHSLVICFVSVAIGAAVQRLSGQGFGLISAPMVALVAPQMLPAAVLLLGFTVGLGSFALDLKHVNPRELPWGFTGRALGAVLAAMVASALPFEKIAVLVALLVLFAVGISLAGLTVAIRKSTLFCAGLVAGLMGTLTAIGAPPMAMLYQSEPPKRSRAMQSTFFLFGMLVSIAALAWQGLVTAQHVRFAIVVLPAIGVGLLASQPLEQRFSKEMVRPAALIFSTISALVLLAKAGFS